MTNYSNLMKDKCDEDTKNILENPLVNIPNLSKAIEISQTYKISLHPRYLFYWNELSSVDLISFLEKLKKIKFKEEDKTIKYSALPSNDKLKKQFEVLGIEHSIKKIAIEKIKSEEEATVIIINNKNTEILLTNLGFDYTKLDKEKLISQFEKIIKFTKENLSKSSCEILTNCSSINLEIRDKGGTYIGCRMGRPEKAKMRKLDGRPQGLFSIGEGKKVKVKEFGETDDKTEMLQNRLKNIVEAYHNGSVDARFCIYHCANCEKDIIYRTCPTCNSKGEQKYFDRYTGTPVNKEKEGAVKYKYTNIDMNEYIENVRKITKTVELPKLVKGLNETINKDHIVEHLSKAFMRAKHDLYVNKDGTVRFDMIEMGLTHFKGKEIGTSVEKLKELGYKKDYLGKDLTDENQLIEIFPQDVILPDCIESGDELASDFVINTGKFVDECLEKLYGVEKFYNFKTKEDTIGHLLIGLAPHTSAGIVGRIIGYSKTQGCFSHPVWHAAQRRNLDGDENGVMLLLDGLINFSRQYLPDRRGAKTMDTSLVLTSHLYLDQVDDEVHGMDIVPYYSLEMYRAAKKFKNPKDIKITKVENKISEEEMDNKYLGYGFTHNTDNLNNTILCSSYKSVPSMKEKMDLQLGIGKKIRAVDEHQVGSFIIDKHFMKDIKGNLRKFGMQTFRCTGCNTIYRRPPLNGRCTHCKKSSINFTIHEGSIKKYLGPSFDIIKNYNVDPYIIETLELTNLRIEGVFGKEKHLQKSLDSFWK